ncbi:MAG: uncharacterized membrane protein YbhN (UPF0104 family) [Bermanella sp.]|jgi:uncharacterized membrane protein YbhN (UPF0104 family)
MQSRVSDKLKYLKAAMRWSKFVFTPLAVGFIVYYAWLSKSELYELFQSTDASWLFVSVFVLIMLHLCSPWFTVLFFKNLGVDVTYKKVAIVHIKYLPAKYLPGGVWHSVARVAEYLKMGLSSRDVSIYFLAENLAIVGVTLGVGGVAASLVFAKSEWLQLFFYLGFAVLFASLAFPVVINQFFAANRKKLQLRGYMFSFSVFILYWIGAACAFVSFFLAFPHFSSEIAPLTIGVAYVFSWGMGYIAIFAPQGIGVTELVSAKLLGNEGVFSVLVVTFVGFRLLMFIADLVAWGLLLLCRLNSTKVRK